MHGCIWIKIHNIKKVTEIIDQINTTMKNRKIALQYFLKNIFEI